MTRAIVDSSVWIEFPPGLFSDMNRGEVIYGISYILKNIAPLYLLCDRQDIGVHGQVKSQKGEVPTIFLYDKYPSGIGLSDKFYTIYNEILVHIIEQIKNCKCESGCPSCISSSLEPDTKEDIITILDEISLNIQ